MLIVRTQMLALRLDQSWLPHSPVAFTEGYSLFIELPFDLKTISRVSRFCNALNSKAVNKIKMQIASHNKI